MTDWRKHLDEALAHNKANPNARKSIQMTYHKQSTRRVVKRKIDPYEIRGSLLFAYDHKRKALRSFKVDRVRNMEKTAFWRGFEKRAGMGAAAAAADLAGLGMLAVPSIQHMRGKHMKESTKHKFELAGLGTLGAAVASPHVMTLGKKLLRRGK